MLWNDPLDRESTEMFSKWTGEKVPQKLVKVMLRATKDRTPWRAMIDYRKGTEREKELVTFEY